MDVRFTVRSRIPRPVEEVFDHVVEPGLLSSYFTRSASGPLEAGAAVEWRWEGDQRETVRVVAVERNRRVEFTWRAYRVPEHTTVTIEFTPDGAGATQVAITESGWKDDQDGLDSAMEHCAGWQHMLLSLRARLLYGIDLRS